MEALQICFVILPPCFGRSFFFFLIIGLFYFWCVWWAQTIVFDHLGVARGLQGGQTQGRKIWMEMVVTVDRGVSMGMTLLWEYRLGVCVFNIFGALHLLIVIRYWWLEFKGLEFRLFLQEPLRVNLLGQ